jgi:hypothetical protein
MRTVDGQMNTLWVSKEGKRYSQWITYDMGRDVNLSKIMLIAPGDTASPKLMNLRYGHKPRGPFTQYCEFEGRMTKRPQSFKLPALQEATARYWRLQMLDNHGSTLHISLVQVEFSPRQEENPHVTLHPASVVLNPGPQLGDEVDVELRCAGVGWPLPSYQWQCDGVNLPGETGQTLKLTLCAPYAPSYKSYRCFRCRKISNRVPMNVLRLICQNCALPYDSSEYTVLKETREKLDEEMMQNQARLKDMEERVLMQRRDLEVLKVQLKALPDDLPSYRLDEKRKLQAQIRGVENSIKMLTQAISDQQRILADFLDKRIDEDQEDPAKPKYSSEGYYTCVVYNMRGGAYKFEAVSNPAGVYCTLPPPLTIKVKEDYKAMRPRRRKDWDKYGTVNGNFKDGYLEGDVMIRYKHGAVYEGPYVDEIWLDSMGSVVQQGRTRAHWGRYTTPEGWIYEGSHVDNHFNVNMKQGELRQISPEGEIFEGTFLDDLPHGIGELRYPDGSRYVGEWFRGVRQGFGNFVTADGSSYEGDWDHNQINGEGIWRWRDGAWYVGSSQNGKRMGKGIFVTSSNDVYIGDFVENRMEGHGIFTYRDGSKYEGGFINNMRDGRGSYMNAKGVKFIGLFIQDRQQGEFKVRRPIVAEVGEEAWEDEIQTGLWDNGEFVKWLDVPMNPKATAQFCDLFEKAEGEEYNGVLAMLVAKNLPFVPNGVDPKNPRVMRVLERIRCEAGELCGMETIKTRKARVQELLPKLEVLSEKYKKVSGKLLSAKKILDEKRAVAEEMEVKAKAMRHETNRLMLHIEQYWLNDLTCARENFYDVIQRLCDCPETQWFQLRQYAEPPMQVWRVMQCVLCLLKLPQDWKTARVLVGDSRANKDMDDVALVEDYDLKLVHMMKTYNVFDYTKETLMLQTVEAIIKHPRFSSENLAIQAYGAGLPLIVDFSKALFAYIKRSDSIYSVYEEWVTTRDRALKLEGQSRDKHARFKEAEQDFFRYEAEESGVMKEKAVIQGEIAECQRLIAECEAMVVMYQPPVVKEDYYSKKMAEMDKSDKLKLEIVMESIFIEVERRATRFWRPIESFDIHEKIYKEIGVFREQLSLWYKQMRPEDGITYEQKREELVQEFFFYILFDINKVLHEDDERQEWVMLKGQVVKADFLRFLIQQAWAEEDHREYVETAIHDWWVMR